MPENLHELQVEAALLARDAGDEEQADKILAMSASDLATLFGEGGAGDDAADTFPGDVQ